MKALILLFLIVSPISSQLFTGYLENNETLSTPEVSQIKFFAHCIVALPIVSVGIVGNLLSLIVLNRPKLSRVLYVYLRGLAVSNLCVLLAAIPALLDISYGLPGGHYLIAFYQAYLKLPLINTFMASSVYIILCMTFNRFCSIWKPDFFRRFHTLRNAVISISLCFIFGILIHIPLCFQNYIVEREMLNQTIKNETTNETWSNVEDITENGTRQLPETEPENGTRQLPETEPENRTEIFYESAEYELVAESDIFKIYLVVSEIFLRIGPIIVLIILNPLIIIKFREISRKKDLLKRNPIFNMDPINYAVAENLCEESAPRVSGQSSLVKRSAQRLKEERMLVLVLISLIILFVFCTTPATILSISYSVKLNYNLNFQVFRAVSNILELLNFTLNFYIYCLCSSEIRSAFVDVFKSIFGCKQEQAPTQGEVKKQEQNHQEKEGKKEQSQKMKNSRNSSGR